MGRAGLHQLLLSVEQIILINLPQATYCSLSRVGLDQLLLSVDRLLVKPAPTALLKVVLREGHC